MEQLPVIKLKDLTSSLQDPVGAELLELLRNKPGKQAHFVGTGVTTGLTKGQAGSASWLGLLQTLRKHLFDKSKLPTYGSASVDLNSALMDTIKLLDGITTLDQFKTEAPFLSTSLKTVQKNSSQLRELVGIMDGVETLAAVDLLINSAIPVGLLAAAYVLRSKLLCSEQWDLCITKAFQEVEVLQKNKDSWHSLYKDLSDRLAPGESTQPERLILTTNYDDLVARCLGWKVLYHEQPDNINNHKLSSPLCSKTELDESSDFCFSKLNFKTMWDLQTSGRLRNNERFVHHLHGWAGCPGSLVLDAVDYHKTESQKSLERALANWLLNDDWCTFFLGVGAGMIDPHFQNIWKRVEPKSRRLINCEDTTPIGVVNIIKSSYYNMWFLKDADPKDPVTRQNDDKEKMNELLRQFSNRPTESSALPPLVVITYETHEQLTQFLNDLLIPTRSSW